jgi:beta-lactam-binding protein with PASTA domain
MSIRRRVPHETIVSQPAAETRIPAAAAEPVVVAGPPPVGGPPVADPLLAPPLDTAVAPLAPEAAYVPPGEIADNRFGMGMLIGLLVLLAIAGVVAAILFTRHHKSASPARTTTTVVVQNTAPATPAAGTKVVPNLIGMAQPDAVTSLRNEGLKVRVVTVPGPAPAGAVLGETPGPQQQLPAGSIVTLRVSNGLATAPQKTASTVTVTTTASTPKAPAQSGTTAAAATPPAVPAPSGSSGSSTEQATTTQATTTAQATTTGQASSTQATTTAAAPPQPTNADVPDVSGQQVKAAASTIARTGFLVTVAYVPGDDPLGTILAESPSAGATAPTTAHITINASSGPGQKQQETVPDATGQTIPQAVSSMQHAGLRLIFLKKPVSERSLAGKVVEQSPAAGKTAPHNAQVLVYMGAFTQSNQ